VFSEWILGFKYWKERDLDDITKPWYKLDEMVTDLGKVKYMDIAVELFDVEIDNHKFGLIANLDSQCVQAQPSSTISFYEPWDGEYYT